MTQPDPRTRLLDLSVEHGTSLAALSALLGRNSSYLQQFVRKGSPRKLEERDRRTLAELHCAPALRHPAGRAGGRSQRLDEAHR